MDKIRFFIGTDANGGCAECQMVLEYSIKKHCSVPYEIVWMALSADVHSFWHGWNTKYWSTPFSGFRYGIPEYCNWEGKAIYQDDDQLWLSDPLELWNSGLGSNVMSGKLLPNGEVRHCVSLIDCAAAKGIIPPASRRKHLDNYCELMKAITFPKTEILNPNFNNYDGENEKIENIKVLHFTDMSTNPGVKLAVKRLGTQAEHWYDGEIREHRRPDIEAVFHQYYEEALAAGFKVENYLPKMKIYYDKQSQAAYRANNGYDVTLGQ